MRSRPCSIACSVIGAVGVATCRLSAISAAGVVDEFGTSFISTSRPCFLKMPSFAATNELLKAVEAEKPSVIFCPAAGCAIESATTAAARPVNSLNIGPPLFWSGSPHPAASTVSVRLHEAVAQHAEAVDLQLDHVAGFKKPALLQAASITDRSGAEELARPYRLVRG